MKFAYASAAKRPTSCEPTGAAGAGEAGITTLPVLVFGPHSVTAIGMFAGQPYAAVARIDGRPGPFAPAVVVENIAGMSTPATAGSAASVLPAYQCTTAKSMLAQLPVNTEGFQFGYCVGWGQLTMPPILIEGSTAFIAVENALTAAPYTSGPSALFPRR